MIFKAVEHPTDNYHVIVIDDDAGTIHSIKDAVPEKVSSNVITYRRPARVINFLAMMSHFSKYWSNYEYIIFIGHHSSINLFDKPWKRQFWRSFRTKKILWCSERINSSIPEWREQSIKNIDFAGKIMDYIFTCDEDDFLNYPDLLFLPQWGSPQFQNAPEWNKKKDKLIFIGQVRSKGYEQRAELMNSIKNDKELAPHFLQLTGRRSLPWNDFVDNVKSYRYLINPIGNLVSFNTRFFEALQAGCVVFQQIDNRFKIHPKLVPEGKAAIYFRDINDLRDKFFAVRNDEDRAKNISENAAKIGKTHTWHSRWAMMLGTISSFKEAN